MKTAMYPPEHRHKDRNFMPLSNGFVGHFNKDDERHYVALIAEVAQWLESRRTQRATL